MLHPTKRGMTQEAWSALVKASVNASIDIDSREDRRVVQAIGDAVASAGFHHQDGTLHGLAYTAAVDLSVRGLSKSQIATWIEELCSQGFVAFFRNWEDNEHIHANYCGVPMKRELDSQNHDFFNGRDGLVSHSRITAEWWYPELERRRIPAAMFAISNGPNPRVVTRADVVKEETQPVTNALYLNNETKPRLWMPVIDGVSYAPVRAWGAIMGFDVQYNPNTKSVEYDGNDRPISVKLLSGIGHAPIRQLVAETGVLKISLVDPAGRKVVVVRGG